MRNIIGMVLILTGFSLLRVALRNLIREKVLGLKKV